MKYLKVWGMAAIAAALMVGSGVGSASATELTCGSEMCPSGTVLHLASEGACCL